MKQIRPFDKRFGRPADSQDARCHSTHDKPSQCFHETHFRHENYGSAFRRVSPRPAGGGDSLFPAAAPTLSAGCDSVPGAATAGLFTVSGACSAPLCRLPEFQSPDTEQTTHGGRRKPGHRVIGSWPAAPSRTGHRISDRMCPLHYHRRAAHAAPFASHAGAGPPRSTSLLTFARLQRPDSCNGDRIGRA